MITLCRWKYWSSSPEPPWTGAWTGCRGTASTASAVGAIAGGISAAHALAPERTYGKEKVYGSIP
jgi:hypothetical protein